MTFTWSLGVLASWHPRLWTPDSVMGPKLLKRFCTIVSEFIYIKFYDNYVFRQIIKKYFCQETKGKKIGKKFFQNTNLSTKNEAE